MGPDQFGSRGIEGREIFVPATIVEQLEVMNLYDERIPQSKVDFPVKQHYYRMKSQEGGETTNCKGRMVLDTRRR